MEILIILLFAFLAIIEAKQDAKSIKNGENIEHSISASIRLLSAGLVSFLLFKDHYWIIFTVILLNSYWIVFDISLNIYRGMSAWYIGKTAKIDRFMRKFTKDGKSYTALKCLLLVISLTIYYLV